MGDFGRFKEATSAQWARMTEHDLYRAAVDGDELWRTYLASFPPGTNPIFRERTEHDCSCCRQFIRAVGNVVAIVGGRKVTLWDVEVDDPAYQAVADAMAALVRAAPIADVFLHPEENAGTDRSVEDLGDGRAHVWHHFHVRIPHRRNSGRDYVRDKARIPTELGERRSTHDVLLRGLTELTLDALDTVLEIVGQGSLYRGSEFRGAVAAFRELKATFDRTPEEGRDLRAWEWTYSVPAAVCRIRNTAIGTLLVDLSAGTELEEAVRKFETSIMAPTNYKRPTALVSQRMVEQARATVEGLGLASALERRHARLADVSVNDVLFADRSVRPAMKGGGAFDGVATRPPVPKDLGRVEAIPIGKFIEEVVPRAQSIEVLLENKHAGNLVSLVAPAAQGARPLFKWDNGFSWSYNGDVADSIRERVKRAGGSVEGDLCCRLAWHNHDDLDLHMQEPRGRHPGHHIHFASKISPATGGRLDVDMNAGRGTTREPVENIFYGDRRRMTEGEYVLYVHQFAQRESRDPGFEVEVDWLGDVTGFAYDRPVRGNVEVARMRYTHAGGLEIVGSMPSRSASREMWGLRSNDFHRVSAMMLSPNHWEGAGGVGNRHYFFMLDGCVNDGTARGFYNEFLRPDLERHRKVLEIVGGRQRTGETPDQLSGLGFSETQRNEVLVRVAGSFNRTLRVQI